MYRFSFFTIALTLLLTSCSKSDEPGNLQEQQEANFYALKVGNSWSYSYFTIDHNGDLQNIGVEEDVEIVAETVIDNETYFTVQTTTVGSCTVCDDEGVTVKKVKDSLGYLVTLEGDILFSNDNTNSYLIHENPWGDVYGVLSADLVEVVVEAGVFTAVRNEVYAIDPNTGDPFIGKDDNLYADGIGLVKRNYHGVSSGQLILERHLIAYQIN
ncbi:MAG: hypothetical protein K8F54_08040 [Altibacter sp.]|uniref:hypothetical protein n=1 Tax=Altibacter sp. TaxID=2024823 RepID=UPI001D5D951D|nr:hypothetical protein [Altibacter sp.]MBZ0327536.1 hypothetical protein [Altibacter sp.]